MSAKDLGLPEEYGADNHEAVVEAFFDQVETPEATEPAEVEAVPTTDPSAGDPEDEDPDSDSDSEASETASEADPEVEEGTNPLDEANTWEERYKALQSHTDQRVAQVQSQLEQMNQWAQQVYQQQLAQQQAQAQAQQAQQATPTHVTDEQIVAAVDQDVERAFIWTATNRPDKIPTLVAAARANEKLGHAVADRMLYEFNQYQLEQTQQRYQQDIQQRDQALVEREAPAQMEAMMGQMIDGIAQQYGEAFTGIQDQFVERAKETAPGFKAYMEQQGLPMTPDAVHYFLTKTVNDVREANIAKQASKPRKARKVAASDHVETSTSGARPEDATPDDLAISELLEGAKHLSMDMTTPTR